MFRRHCTGQIFGLAGAFHCGGGAGFPVNQPLFQSFFLPLIKIKAKVTFNNKYEIFYIWFLP